MYIHPDREMRAGCYRNGSSVMWQRRGKRGGKEGERQG